MKRFVLAYALLAVPVAAQVPAPAPSPSKSDGHMKAAAEKQAAGDLDGALVLLQKAIKEADAMGEAFLALGKLYEKRFEVDMAVDTLRSAAGKLVGPAKGEALGRLAVLEDLRGMEGFIAEAEAAVAADAEGLWPTLALARARAAQGKAEEAVALAGKAVAMPGSGAPALAALGVAHRATGDLAAAEKALREAVAADATYPPGTLGLAGLLRQTGRAAEALPIVQAVIDKVPGAISAYKESARIKIALGQAMDALGDANIAAAMNEKDVDAQNLVMEVRVAKALEMLAKGDLELALQDLEALKAQSPDSADVRLGLGRVYVSMRQADLAIAELQKATELDPKNAEAHFLLAKTQHTMKATAAAVSAALPLYEKAIALDPGNVAYREFYGAALAFTQKSDKAIAELEKVVASPGYDRAFGWFNLGQAYLGAGRHKDAAGALEKALAKSPSDASAEAMLAWAYAGLKDTDNFKLHATKARQLGYKEAQLLERLKRIEAGEKFK